MISYDISGIVQSTERITSSAQASARSDPVHVYSGVGTCLGEVGESGWIISTTGEILHHPFFKIYVTEIKQFSAEISI